MVSQDFPGNVIGTFSSILSVPFKDDDSSLGQALCVFFLSQPVYISAISFSSGIRKSEIESSFFSKLASVSIFVGFASRIIPGFRKSACPSFSSFAVAAGCRARVVIAGLAGREF